MALLVPDPPIRPAPPEAQVLHSPQSSSSSPSFHPFPHLPVELRSKIWQHSFSSRVIELRARQSHYANDYQHGGVLRWQSGCTNPAALFVNTEARTAAIEHYTVKFPLAMTAPCERAGDSILNLYRMLYISPSVDTIVMLSDIDYHRLTSLLSDFRHYDPDGNGVKSLALSARWSHHQGVGDMLRVFSRTIFRDLHEMIIFIFTESMPPTD